MKNVSTSQSKASADESACEIKLSYKESLAAASVFEKFRHRIHSELDIIHLYREIGESLKEALNDQTVSAIAAYHLDESIKIMVVHGFIIDLGAIPETPTIKSSEVSSIVSTVIFQVGLAYIRGEYPQSFINENQGRLFRDVVGKLASRNALSSQGSKKNLTSHVDYAHRLTAGVEVGKSQAAPQSLTLAALRSDLKTGTLFLDEKKLVAPLKAKFGEDIYLEEFVVGSPESVENEPPFTGAPLFIERDGTTHIRFNGKVTAMTDRARDILEEIEKLLTRPQLWVEVLLLPGSMVTWKNNRVLHARSGYEPLFNGADRWYIRMFSSKKEFVQAINPDIPYLCR